MRIAVCDDEKYFRNAICEAITSFYKSLDVICTAFESGRALISAFEKGKRFDAVFLDIEMPEPDGMETAKRLHEFSADLPVIFLTSHTELAMDGYEVGAFRFLQKPVITAKLTQALKDIRQLTADNKNLCIRSDGEEYYISPDSIIYAEADNNTVRFITSEKEYKMRLKMTEAMTMLEGVSDHFCRVHRSVIVNLSHIVSRNEKEVKLDSGVILPVSKSYVDEMKKRLVEYIRLNAR
ncbi:LytR/AlgR family response regulator transcription factor [Ruminococcus flavefaciens]|uniref:Stage 0 sporulation protein A homolog n=1 Tax=Ruminococcus flavefaciens TaxID=1265 RepID=A0A1M7I1F4_RUMFL|nr:LytTR family DNA-binding domain-containing protein [Ruminococcus flavefaciens]SHM34535.1 two component transcriptional regulator, LytTR family [Ruminococcus flavefaciens]